jgi:hypothetical protein
VDAQAEIIEAVLEAAQAGATLPRPKPWGDAVRLRGGV